LPAEFYNENATELAQQYLSKTFDQVHQSRCQLLPAIIENPNARILDIGAGSGCDAKYIAQSGLSSDNSSVDDLFEVLLVQRGHLTEIQQLRGW